MDNVAEGNTLSPSLTPSLSLPVSLRVPETVTNIFFFRLSLYDHLYNACCELCVRVVSGV